MRSLKTLLLILISLCSVHLHAEPLRFVCRGWAPLYLSSWTPENPIPTDFDMMNLEADEATGMVRVDLAMVGRLLFTGSISDYAIKAAIPYRRMMVDDFIEIIDFYYNRPVRSSLPPWRKKPAKDILCLKGNVAVLSP
jgi:hypothetical protein